MKKIKQILSSVRSPKMIALYVSGMFIAILAIIYIGNRMGIFFQADPGNEPVSYWKFDEGVGSTANDAIGTNTGTLGTGNSAPTWVGEDQCVSGKCLKFDGSNDKVQIASNSSIGNLTSSLTVSAWFKLNTVSGTQRIFGSYRGATHDGFAFGASGTNLIFTTYSIKDYVSSAVTLSANRWYHVTAVMDSSYDVTFYVDGNQIETVTHNAASVANTDDIFLIGTDGTEYLNGYIDEIKVYDYVRSAAQIKADYASRGSVNGVAVQFGDDDLSRKLSSGLVGYWKMDEVGVSGSNWTAVDSSGNNNNGTGAGNASVGTTYPGKFGNAGFFDGGGDWIDLGSSLNMSTEHTLSFWLNYYNASDAVVLGNVNSQYGAYIDGPSSGGAIYYRPNPSSNYVSVVHGGLTQGTWYHFTIIRDDTQVTFYKNNIKLSTTQTLDSNYDMLIDCFGANCNSNGFPLYGFIDEIRFYNRVLDPSEIKALYQWAPGPVGYWKMDEGSGTTSINDSSGIGLTGSMNGSMTNADWAAGKYGKALDFDGSNDYIQVIDPGTNSILDFNNGKQITITAWFNPKTIPAEGEFQTIITKGLTDGTNDDLNYGVYWGKESGSGDLVFDFCYTNSVGSYHCAVTTNTQPIVVGQWHHVAVTYTFGTGSSVKLYFNGNLVASNWSAGTGNDAPNVTNEALWIGADNYPGALAVDERMNGRIDDVKIYNYARTPSQIIEDMNAGHPAVGTPVGSARLHMKMDEGYGTTIYSSLSVGGTIVGTFGTGSSAPTWTNDGKYGKALLFDGTSDYVSTSGNLAFGTSDSWSASLWLKEQPGDSDWSFFLGERGTTTESLLYRSTTNLLQFRGSDSTYVGGPVVDRDQWNHVAMTYNASEIYLYLNGMRSGPYTLASTMDFTGIGNAYTNDHYFRGYIDEVKVYPFALTADQMKIDYNQGKAMVMGAGSTGIGGTSPNNSNSREYCVPGDSSTCNAPVAEWNFEEGVGGTANDTSGNGNTGILLGTSAPTWSSGKKGKSLTFDGLNDYARMGSPAITDNLPSGTFSVQVWVKFTSLSSSNDVKKIIVGKSEEFNYKWHLAARGNGVGVNLNATLDNVAHATSSDTLSRNQWYQFVMTYDNAAASRVIKLYINGREVTYSTQVAMSGSYSGDSSQNVFLGAYDGGNGNIQGQIDDIRIYNYIRTPAQIAWEYNKGGPIGYWKLNEGVGSTAYDSSGNSNNLAITIGASGTQTSAGTFSSGNSAHAWNNGTTGKREGSLNFDSTDDYVTSGTDVSLFDFTEGNDFSYSVWVKPTTLASNRTILAKKAGTGAGSAGYMSLVNTQGKIATYVSDGTDDVSKFTDVTISAGEWSYITVVYIDDTSLTTYINGKDGRGSLTGTIGNVDDVNTTSHFVIGAESDAQIPMFGQIDEVKVFNYALTPQQIKTDLNVGAVRFQ